MIDISKAYYASGTDHIWNIGNWNLPVPVKKDTAIIYSAVIIAPAIFIVLFSGQMLAAVWYTIIAASIIVPLNVIVEERYEVSLIKMGKILYLQFTNNRDMEQKHFKGKVCTFIEV